ncbi:hypothetical protein BIW11_02291 [Tropilaelaps mercedesae]|uniref:Secreted protein n=1 Tax=Tropilaelaps mercedesae TaxID=418985 RepID=A0A1V9X094_9ACAR|nr:hypothetical protein BIW11_02291 [Tropilaelaps mercedesae]
MAASVASGFLAALAAIAIHTHVTGVTPEESTKRSPPSETRERIEMAGGREVVSSAKKSSSVRAKKQRREPLNLMDDNRPLGGVLDGPSTMPANATLPGSTTMSNGSLLDRGPERLNRMELAEVSRQHRQQQQQTQQHDVVYDDDIGR